MGTMLGLIFLVLSAAIQSECEGTVVKVKPVKPEGPEVTVEPGQNVTLPCQTDDVNIRAAEWIRSDLVDPDYVLFYRNGHSDPTHQHSSFTGRVQLVDGELKNGDVSLILKNVSREDVGTYECRVQAAGSSRKKTISSVQLKEYVVVRVEPGQDVTLPCQTGDVTITAAEWTRSDLVAPDYVLLYRDGHSDPEHQHSNFTGRVQLVNSELKNGNVSLILKNVKREDVGTYECRVKTAGSRRKRRATIDDSDPISIIQLQVTEDQKGGIKDGHNGDMKDGASTPHHGGLGAAGVFLLVCLVSAAVGLFLVRKSKRQREKKPEPSADEETGDDLL